MHVQVYSCDDCGDCGLQTVATMDLAAGSYFVIQSGYSTRSGTYVMNVSCPVGAYNWHPDPVQCGQTYRGSTGGQGGSQVQCVDYCTCISEFLQLIGVRDGLVIWF